VGCTVSNSRNRRRAFLTLALALALAVGTGTAGCASAPIIPLHGDPFDFRTLVGEWDGVYNSGGNREGSIWFKLVEGEDHAHGDVLMHPRGGLPYVSYGLHGYPGQYLQSETSRLLMIRFVRVARNQLDGVLEPYWDPACDCAATTTFRGRLEDGLLRGTFETRSAGALTATGRWSATRRGN
jgi:hypothetical protein